MKGEVARIHREGVISELKQIGKELDPKYSIEWFEKNWTGYEVKIPGFVAEIDGEVMIYVSPEYQRKGIGTALLGNTSKAWVIKGNKTAEMFYAKNGFTNTMKQRMVVMFGHEVAECLWERK